MSQALPLITRQGDRIAIVSGLRTPFARQATAFHGIPAVDLGKMVVGEMLARSEIPPEVIEQLVFGQVVQMPEAPNIAREIVLGTGMNVHTDAYSVSRACATSFQAKKLPMRWWICPLLCPPLWRAFRSRPCLRATAGWGATWSPWALSWRFALAGWWWR